MRSLLSGLTSVFKRLCPSQLESCFDYCMSCPDAFISASNNKGVIGSYFVFQKLMLVRHLVGMVNDIFSTLIRSLVSEM